MLLQIWTQPGKDRTWSAGNLPGPDSYHYYPAGRLFKSGQIEPNGFSRARKAGASALLDDLAMGKHIRCGGPREGQGQVEDPDGIETAELVALRVQSRQGDFQLPEGSPSGFGRRGGHGGGGYGIALAGAAADHKQKDHGGLG